MTPKTKARVVLARAELAQAERALGDALARRWAAIAELPEAPKDGMCECGQTDPEFSWQLCGDAYATMVEFHADVNEYVCYDDRGPIDESTLFLECQSCMATYRIDNINFV